MIVPLSNIESLVIAKIQIEKLLKNKDKISEKMRIDEFVNDYGRLGDAFIDHGNATPFNLVLVEGNWYCFVADEDKENESLETILRETNCDLSNLTKISDEELATRFPDLSKATYFLIKGSNYIL